MLKKDFDVNIPGHCIRCKLYGNEPRGFQKVILCGHGFGGHRGNRAMERYAERTLSKYKSTAVVVFDLPAHGDDVKKKLTLTDCDTYITAVTEHIRNSMQVPDIYVYATSFGAFLFLWYLQKHGNPYRKLAFRCPAVRMYQVMQSSILQSKDATLLEKGKDALIGFDRKVRISGDFLRELEAADLWELPFFDYADDLLLIHGTKDEIIPIAQVQEFADNNCIEFLPIEKADHRFSDPTTMDLATQAVNRFFAFD